MFSVWNEKNNIFSAKHDQCLFKTQGVFLQFAAQWTEHASRLTGSRDHVHSTGSFLATAAPLAFSLPPMNEKVISPLQSAYSFSLCISLKLTVESRTQTLVGNTILECLIGGVFNLF